MQHFLHFSCFQNWTLQGSAFYGCRTCDYDECEACAMTPRPAKAQAPVSCWKLKNFDTPLRCQVPEKKEPEKPEKPSAPVEPSGASRDRSWTSNYHHIWLTKSRNQVVPRRTQLRLKLLAQELILSLSDSGFVISFVVRIAYNFVAVHIKCSEIWHQVLPISCDNKRNFQHGFL